MAMGKIIKIMMVAIFLNPIPFSVLCSIWRTLFIITKRHLQWFIGLFGYFCFPVRVAPIHHCLAK
jgi:hypothetical protein